jgi:hypothetical protein
MPDLRPGTITTRTSSSWATTEARGFYLAPQIFEGARWLSPTQHDLWIEQGPYLVVSVIAPSRVDRT